MNRKEYNDLCKIITVHNWWQYKERFTPPLIGPYDIRINHNRLSVPDYFNLQGIPRLLKEAKYRQQCVEKGKSLFSLCSHYREEHPALWQAIAEDEERLAFLKEKINNSII